MVSRGGKHEIEYARIEFGEKGGLGLGFSLLLGKGIRCFDGGRLLDVLGAVIAGRRARYGLGVIGHLGIRVLLLLVLGIRGMSVIWLAIVGLGV